MFLIIPISFFPIPNQELFKVFITILSNLTVLDNAFQIANSDFLT